MGRGAGALAAIAIAVQLMTGVAAAQGPGQVSLRASLDDKGYVGFTTASPDGRPVEVGEYVSGQFVPVFSSSAPAGVTVRRRRVLAWRCERPKRIFAARSVTRTAATSDPVRVRTPGCRHRLDVVVRPDRPRAGRPLSVLVVDRFGSGDFDARVCARPPGAKRRCRTAHLAKGRSRAAVRFRASAGRWPVTVTTPGAPPVRRLATVRRRGGGLRILATGDSMIQIIDSFLQQRLQRGRVRVRKESHISTGISKPGFFNWNNRARAQARSIRPDATVVFLGANDGFPIGAAQCCGRGWVRGYARRVRDMMRSYSRGGAGTVYWLLLPVPRRGDFKPIYRAVNSAVTRAARRFPDTVRLVHLESRFTPGGRYTPSIVVRGRRVQVRQDDGVHLNTAGASIAAGVIIRALRRDGVL